MNKHERPETRAVDKLDLGKIEDDVFVGLGQALDMGPDTGDIGGVKIVFNFMLLRH